jgi:ABC-type multidrug transport system ATPase subunit
LSFRLPVLARQAEHYLRLFELWDRRDDLAGTLSKGMRQKLAIAAYSIIGEVGQVIRWKPLPR